MELLSPHDYIAAATACINRASKRVSFISMVVTDDASTDQLIDALTAAASRGVEVRVAGDMFTYTELSGQFIPSHYYSKRVRSTTRMTKKLSNAGVDFHWLGRLNVTTFSGRTHSKWCVADNTVFSFGGVNLYEEATRNIDYMFRTEDAALADKLFIEHDRIVRADKNRYSYRSHSLILNKQSTVLFDAGLFGDSIIYQRAYELAEKATHVTYVSQYCPTGKLSRLLKKTATTFYFNPWQSAKGFNRFVIRVGVFLTGHDTSYKKSTYIHAKCMIFQFKDGTKTAITGSHNFVHGGVLMGTREIALETNDISIIEQLEQFIEQNIA